MFDININSIDKWMLQFFVILFLIGILTVTKNYYESSVTE